jgi:hypothetical protein
MALSSALHHLLQRAGHRGRLFAMPALVEITVIRA